VSQQPDDEEDGGESDITTTRATMRPRRFRSSMSLVPIMPAVGIGDPRWSFATSTGTGTGLGAGGNTSEIVVIAQIPAG